MVPVFHSMTHGKRRNATGAGFAPQPFLATPHYGTGGGSVLTLPSLDLGKVDRAGLYKSWFGTHTHTHVLLVHGRTHRQST